jgi:hypothetical protein
MEISTALPEIRYQVPIIRLGSADARRALGRAFVIAHGNASDRLGEDAIRKRCYGQSRSPA